MLSKLPRWVEVGGFWLAAIAGAVNAIGLLGFRHEAVSHVTGTSSLLSLAVARGEVADALHLLLIVFAFLAGALAYGRVGLRARRRTRTAAPRARRAGAVRCV